MMWYNIYLDTKWGGVVFPFQKKLNNRIVPVNAYNKLNYITFLMTSN